MADELSEFELSEGSELSLLEEEIESEEAELETSSSESSTTDTEIEVLGSITTAIE